MPKFVTKNATVLLAGRELAALVYQIDFGASAPDKPCTNYASPGGWQEYGQGIRTTDWTVEGYQDVPDPEKKFFEQFTGGAPFPVGMTFTRPRAAGDLLWFTNAIVKSQADRLPIGEWHGFSLTMKGATLVRGSCFETIDAAGTGNSAAVNSGSVPAGSRLHFAMWVLSAAGTTPTLDAILQSDDSGGFASPTSRIVVPQFDKDGYFYGTIDGPITDTWWRISRTVGGSGSPSFAYVAALGIVPIS